MDARFCRHVVDWRMSLSRAAQVLSRRRRAVYPLGRRTVAELRDVLHLARWALVIQCDEDGWWAEIFTFRGPARVHGCRTPIEALDQVIAVACTYAYVVST